MKVVHDDNGFAGVELTRRNLRALLTKLDGFPAGSACTIMDGRVFVRAVEDEVHYAGRKPGPMHGDTEAKL